jgi:preprotein translocase subunit SecG
MTDLPAAFAASADLAALAGGVMAGALSPTLAVTGGSILTAFLLVAFLLVSLGMILVVLIQKPQGGGLSGAFGAAADGAGQTAMGVKTGDALTTMTIAIFLLFLTFAVLLNYQVRPSEAAPQNVVAADTEGGAAMDNEDAGATGGEAAPATEPEPEPTPEPAPAGSDQSESAADSTPEAGATTPPATEGTAGDNG